MMIIALTILAISAFLLGAFFFFVGEEEIFLLNFVRERKPNE
jgi:hypothetical protein